MIASAVTLALVLATAAAQAVPAASPDRPSLAVRTFENPSTMAASTIGSGLTHIFITELEKTGAYRIIEREALTTLTDEIDLADTGYLSPDTAAKKGHVEGVEYWFLATVTNFGADEKSMAGGVVVPVIAGLGMNRKTARVRLDFRIVDATSGETVMADFGEAAVKRTSVAGAGFIDMVAGGDWYQSSEFLDSMIGRATINAIEQIIDKMRVRLPEARRKASAERRRELAARDGRVLAVTDGSAFVDMGSEAGVAVGDVIEIVDVQPILDSAGNVVFDERIRVGEATISEVRLDRSRASFAAGLGIREGQVVRVKARPVPVPASGTAPADEPTAPEVETRPRGSRRSSLRR